MDDHSARFETALDFEAASASHDLATRLVEAALFDPDHSVLQTFSLAGVPAAVLLGTDGLLAGGPVTGGNAIADMVDEMRVQLSDATDLAPAQPGDESEQVASPA